MPELPDLTIYLEHLAARLCERALTGIRILNPFVLRTVAPTVDTLAGRRITAVQRIGKRLVLVFDGDYYAVIHLMVAGRLRWLDVGARAPARISLAAFDTDRGTLLLTEAGTKRRASLHLVAGAAALAAFDLGGLEVATATPHDFAARLILENHTLKRALTDPKLFAGIGNAYSDEILHRAKLSPLVLTRQLDAAAIERLRVACIDVLAEWTDRLRREAGASFPERVTAFRPEMAVHGKFGQPCPVCAAPVQRIVYAENECNYCARCQTGGKLLADRALSRLLKASWPRSIDELG